jgi:DNA-directed RNA polymerase omega subunit
MQQYVSRGTTIDTDLCVENMGGNRYDLVIVAAARARELTMKNKHSDKFWHLHTPVTALLEVQEGKLTIEGIRKVV